MRASVVEAVGRERSEPSKRRGATATKGSHNEFGWLSIGKVTFPTRGYCKAFVDPAQCFAFRTFACSVLRTLNPQKFDYGLRPPLRMTCWLLVLLPSHKVRTTITAHTTCHNSSRLRRAQTFHTRSVFHALVHFTNPARDLFHCAERPLLVHFTNPARDLFHCAERPALAPLPPQKSSRPDAKPHRGESCSYPSKLNSGSR